jgi:tripeptide aminopeptidase
MNKAQDSVLKYLRAAEDEIIREQIAFAEIPSPDWKAPARAEHLVGRWRADGLDAVKDRVGNVIAIRHGAHHRKRDRATLILCAHIDSVFYDVKEIRVKREGSILRAPGICDNAAGVASLVLVARALKRFDVETTADIIFVGSVGEEGEGRLAGMRHFFRANSFESPFFIAIDGSGPGSITRKALASWSPKITVKGPGGHSYANFGRPNPVHMLARFIAKITTLKGDKDTNTVYNATVISGGTAVNVIPAEAHMTLNLRSSNLERLEHLKAQARKFLKEARREELEWATSDKTLDVRFTALERPGGETPESSFLVQAAIAALKAEGVTPMFDVKSTDANMPMSLGIPAITVASGGKAGNAHALDEWHDITGRTKELAALARMAFAVAE